jgi:hypothetical protein
MQTYIKIVKKKPAFPAQIHSQSKNLMKALLRRDVSKRLGNLKHGAQDVMCHPAFMGIKFPDLVAKKVVPKFIPNDSLAKHSFTESQFTKNKADYGEKVDMTKDPFLSW